MTSSGNATFEGKQMHHYILQLSFYYTIKGHIEIFYNLEFKQHQQKLLQLHSNGNY